MVTSLVDRIRMTRRKPARGFTLVELLVAMAMGLIVLTIMFTMFRTSSRSYALQDQVAEMQQNLGVAMSTVSRDLRMAGCGANLLDSLVTSIQVFNGGVWQNVKPVTGTNSGTAPDTLQVFYGNVRSGEYDASLTTMVPNATFDLTLDTISGFNVNDGVVVSDGLKATLFIVSGISGLNLQHASSYSNLNPTAAFSTFPSGTGYAIGARAYNFGTIKWGSYYVDSATDPAHPTLMVDLHDGTGAQVVADNVEDMQCHYFFLDGTESDNPAASVAQVKAVRLSLVVRTAQPDQDAATKFSKITLEDHNPGAAKDGYRRRVLSTVIKLRNAGV